MDGGLYASLYLQLSWDTEVLAADLDCGLRERTASVLSVSVSRALVIIVIPHNSAELGSRLDPCNCERTLANFPVRSYSWKS